MTANRSGFASTLALGVVIACGSSVITPTCSGAVDEATAKPYKIVNSAQIMGSGGIDYVFADKDILFEAIQVAESGVLRIGQRKVPDTNLRLAMIGDSIL